MPPKAKKPRLTGPQAPGPRLRPQTTPTDTNTDQSAATTPKKKTKTKPTFNREITEALCTKNDTAKVTQFLNKRAPVTTHPRFRLETYTEVVFDEHGKYQLPPSKVKLSDEHVYLVTKFLSTQQRKQRDWSEDFNHAGDIKADRVPLAPSPLFWAFGVPFIAVYKGYYILVGSQADDFGVALNVKNDATLKAAPADWFIGLVIASREFQDAPRNLTRTYLTSKSVTTTVRSTQRTLTTDALMPNELPQPNTPERYDNITKLQDHYDYSLSYTGYNLVLTHICDHPDYRADNDKPKKDDNKELTSRFAEAQATAKVAADNMLLSSLSRNFRPSSISSPGSTRTTSVSIATSFSWTISTSSTWRNPKWPTSRKPTPPIFATGMTSKHASKTMTSPPRLGRSWKTT
jgi:hypothetical protein